MDDGLQIGGQKATQREKSSSDKKSAMADSSACCVVCDRTSDLVCKKCKTEVYCSPECQLQGWKVHKPHCKRKELAAVPCDGCGDTEKFIGVCCIECGFLFCESCRDQIFDRTTVSSATCPRCEKAMGQDFPEAIEKLLERVKESSDDPRLAQWLVVLGWLSEALGSDDGEQNAMKYFKRAGKLGLGEGYGRLASIYHEKQNWTEAKRYGLKAANLHDVSSIYMMGIEAFNGFMHPLQEEKHEPEYEEAFRWLMAGAQLGDIGCCAELCTCYFHGFGIEQNLAKSFKWSQRAAKQGHPRCMRRCAECYLFGHGVEQSDEQAIYWFEKSLELEDNEDVRNCLQDLQSL